MLRWFFLKLVFSVTYAHGDGNDQVFFNFILFILFINKSIPLLPPKHFTVYVYVYTHKHTQLLRLKGLE